MDLETVELLLKQNEIALEKIEKKGVVILMPPCLGDAVSRDSYGILEPSSAKQGVIPAVVLQNIEVYHQYIKLLEQALEDYQHQRANAKKAAEALKEEQARLKETRAPPTEGEPDAKKAKAVPVTHVAPPPVTAMKK